MMTSPSAPPRKKKTSGLVLLLGVIGGGFLLITVALRLVVWRVMSTPGGQAIVGAVGESVRIMQKAQKAPGTKELRAMGCKTAMVLDMDELARLAQSFDGSRPKQPPTESMGSMVACGVQP